MVMLQAVTPTAMKSTCYTCTYVVAMTSTCYTCTYVVFMKCTTFAVCSFGVKTEELPLSLRLVHACIYVRCSERAEHMLANHTPWWNWLALYSTTRPSYTLPAQSGSAEKCHRLTQEQPRLLLFSFPAEEAALVTKRHVASFLVIVLLTHIVASLTCIACNVACLNISLQSSTCTEEGEGPIIKKLKKTVEAAEWKDMISYRHVHKLWTKNIHLTQALCVVINPCLICCYCGRPHEKLGSLKEGYLAWIWLSKLDINIGVRPVKITELKKGM